MLSLGRGWLSTTYSRRILDRKLNGFRHMFQGIVLDVGGRRLGQVQYNALLGQKVTRWIKLNIDLATRPDLVADAAALPLVSDAVDVVLCTQVIEHTEQPTRVVEEMYRVLRGLDPASEWPGGVLVLSAPFLYRVHGAPYDYLRFTEYCLRRWLEGEGFSVLQIEKLGLFFTVLCDMIKQAISELRPAALRWGLGLLLLPVAEMLIQLEGLSRMQRSPALNTYTTGYLIVARKLGQGNSVEWTKNT